MYCSTCGAQIETKLNYCNRCGARVDKLTATENSSATGYLSMATGFVGLGGLGLTVGLISLLLKHGVVLDAVVILALAFLATVLGITFMMIRQISRMSDAPSSSQRNEFQKPQLDALVTAQLDKPRQPAMSVTDHTTKTLDEIPLKR